MESEDAKTGSTCRVFNLQGLLIRLSRIRNDREKFSVSPCLRGEKDLTKKKPRRSEA
jgi:hypothetical protein